MAASTGNDPALDALLVRLHTETACRRGGALALRVADLDVDQCLVLLREKNDADAVAAGLADTHAAFARARRPAERACGW
nr:hypothetical protein [Actinopolyspora mortivallis]